MAVVGTVAADDGKSTSLRAQVAAAVRGSSGSRSMTWSSCRAGAIPRTTSGKIQRVKVRELYLSGGW